MAPPLGIVFVLEPILSHLSFIYGSIIFQKANLNEARVVRKLLKVYKIASSQQVNMAKTNVMFGKGASITREE